MAFPPPLWGGAPKGRRGSGRRGLAPQRLFRDDKKDGALPVTPDLIRGLTHVCGLSDNTARALKTSRKQLTAYQHASDFTSPCADFIELGIAQDTPCWIFIDIAISAQKLDRI